MTEEKDDGMCRSCVGNKCVTGSECVTLGRDASPPREIPAEQVLEQLRGGLEKALRDDGYEFAHEGRAVCEWLKEIATSTPKAAEQAAPTEPDEAAAWDFTLWLQRLMALADRYWEASPAARFRERSPLLQHATQAGMHWRARSLAAHPHEAADRSAEAKDGARRWLAVVQQKADGARENAQALRKFPGQEQEARARELAAMYLVETAHLMAMDEAHAESLEALHASSQRVATVLAAMGTPAAAEPEKSRE